MKIFLLKRPVLYIHVIITLIGFLLINIFYVSDLNSFNKYMDYLDNVNYDYTVRLNTIKQDSYLEFNYTFSKFINQDGSFSGYVDAEALMILNIKYSDLGYYKEENIKSGIYGDLNDEEISITVSIKDSHHI